MTGSTQQHQHIIHPHQREPPPPQVKPIRFITNDGGPYAKRRRISSACHTCRRRKTRCSGERPECDTCKQGGHECKGYGSADGDHSATSPNQDGHEAKTNNNGDAKNSLDDRRSHYSPSRNKSGNYIRRPSLHHAPSVESTNSTPSTLLNLDNDGTLKRHDSTPGSSCLTLSIRNRMPYFRYFGPTAIMPGFKQMVVKVNEKRGTTATSSGGEMLGSSPKTLPGIGKATPSHGTEAPAPMDPPIYDTSEVAPSPLIIHLCETFFTHLGCSFPFLQKERFMRDLEEKQVDAILVDAVCALAARFSNESELVGKNSATLGLSTTPPPEIPPPERGQAFAHRAKSSIVEAFPCPSVAVVQAALLLAYDEFGASRDSGLWMYLGIAIRMAQDLGMQKLQGLRYIGVTGPTPQSLKYTRKKKNGNRFEQPQPYDIGHTPEDEGQISELKAIERERVDTFWAVFCLDRYISSGTGRPVALRDEDIEVAFPPLDEVDPETQWPLPWPALIRIVHLYGRVSDVLNGIKEVSHVTTDVIDRLGTLEKNLTDIYQGLLPKLHFNAVNFQYYASIGQGTNFIMLHFWFHTLIVLLHQPTLLHTFEGEIQQLFPKSRELSISSAKTIADIISFAELINGKSALGNPFTSQPTYIAACAFLKESASHAISSRPPSRASSPSAEDNKSCMSGANLQGTKSNPLKISPEKRTDKPSVDQQLAAKHSLLASAANQNYQRCYRALQQLETYWAGTKYILTVLDQKAKGVVDPLLYTREEMESALEVPKPEPSFTSPGWRRKLSWGAYLGARAHGSPVQSFTGVLDPPTPGLDPSQAIAWSLAGTVNSPKSASLAVLYPSANTRDVTSQPVPPLAQLTSTIPQAPMHHPPMYPIPRHHNQSVNQIIDPSPNFNNTNPQVDASRIPVSDADLLLNLHSPYQNQSPQLPNSMPHLTGTAQQPFVDQSSNHLNSQQQQQQQAQQQQQQNTFPYGNMMIESQDIDMSVLGDDMMWLEYLPSDNLNFFDHGSTGNHPGV